MTHLEAARRNREHAPKAPTREWQIVMYFYAAVHAVTAHKYSSRRSEDGFDHTARKAYVAQNLAAIREDYQALFNLGHNARYKPWLHEMDQCEVDEAKRCCDAIIKGCGF